MDIKENKKEVVHSRLRQNAAKFWGYRDSEMEGFDPVIDMLFGACSVEFERLSTSLYNSRSRILEKVAQILLPEVNLRPIPAYAVIQAKPVLAMRMTNPTDQFVIEKENTHTLNNKSEQKKIFFSPTPGFRLIDAEVMFLATSGEVMQVSELNKEIKIRSKVKSASHQQTLWMGLKLNQSISSLKDVSFYFDWFNNPNKNYLLRLLQSARWFYKGNEIDVKSGYSQEIDDLYKDISIDLESFMDINTKTEKIINGFFKDSFITISSAVTPETGTFPAVFYDFYTSEDLEKIKEKLCWLEIQFPEIFPHEAFASIFCTPNAFPVMNRRLHRSNRPFAINADLNILPLQTDDMFFTIRKIISGNQINYQELPFKRASDFDPGTYTVRMKGVKRFDERDAYEHVLYLLELLREEYASFRSLNASMIEKELNDLQIIINRLQLNVSKLSSEQNNSHFIFMKSSVAEDIWLEYWSTTGPFANNITRGSQCSNGDFDKKYTIFLTTSTGGKNPPDQLERTLLFKNELLTRNRIVTIEDIQQFCKAELGKDLDKVIIKRDISLDPDRNKGFRNCIRVLLKFSNEKSETEKENILNHIEKSLQQRSSCMSNYKVECVNE
jgi:hypothetical protein